MTVTGPAIKASTAPLSDEELLAACTSERRQSAGFEEDNVLLTAREQALNYIKGYMPDLPTLDNRSRAVSTDVADAIETVMPDLMEIFVGGDDVVSFIPNSEEDEKQAEQESDYVKHVVFNMNDGFQVIYDMCKDALELKSGQAFAWWEDGQPQEEDFEGKGEDELSIAALSSEIINLKKDPQDDPQQPPTFSFTARKKTKGQVKIKSLAPEDFTIARDATCITDAAYVAFRARPRAQDLKEMGMDSDDVDMLPQYGSMTDETLRLARDDAGENSDQRAVSGNHDMRQVEVISHFIKVNADGKGVRYWLVETGGDESVLLRKRPIRRVDIAAMTPFPIPHRFYGMSLADKLIPIQQQGTALKRIMLDSAYFAMNQRMEVDEQKSGPFTIADLLRNEPAMPIRVKTGGAVTPIKAGELNFAVLDALEFTKAEGEQRSGVVRNAQGLNPDSLHETAGGAIALMGAAQKRTRMIARVFAETGLRDLYLIVHALIREHAEEAEMVKLRGKWAAVDPTTWGERDQMAIEVGLGSAGRAQDLAMLTQLGNVQKEIIMAPSGGSIVTPENVFNLATSMAEKAGIKAPQRYFSDPAQNAQQAPPDPEMMKAQQEQGQHQDKMQLQAQDQQADAQLAQAKLQQDGQLAAMQANAQAQAQAAQNDLAREKLERDDQFRYTQLAQTAQLAREEREARTQIEQAKLQAGFQQAVTVQDMKDQNDDKQREADLEIQASEAEDARVLDD